MMQIGGRPEQQLLHTSHTSAGTDAGTHTSCFVFVLVGGYVSFLFFFFSEFFSLSLCGVGVGLVWGCLGSGKNFGQ